MNIAHISDLHLSTSFNRNQLDDIELALQYISSSEVEHLVVTGDLTDNANPNDFLALRDLFEKYNFLNSDRLSVIIGNHDVFGGIQKREDIFSFPDKCRTVNYQEKVNDFYSYFHESFTGCAYFSLHNKYPYAKIFNDVLIVGLNSVNKYSRIKNPFASNGSINFQQLTELAGILESFKNVKHKIVLIHHFFNDMSINPNGNLLWQNIEKRTMKLKQKKRLLNLFHKYNIDLVLHGHYHCSEEYYRYGLRFSNAGASFKGRINNEIGINIISLDDKSIDLSIHKIKSKSIIPYYNFEKFIHSSQFRLLSVLRQLRLLFKIKAQGKF